MKGLEFNYATKRMYIYSSTSLYELTIINEEKDQRNLYLERRDYSKTLENCKNDAKARRYISDLDVDSEFDKELYLTAATNIWSQTGHLRRWF